jgi:indole-3-glycerol phosphate synthase
MLVSLDQIVASTRKRIARCKAEASRSQLERQAENHVPRGFRRALVEKSAIGTAVITELKKASPSRGVIRVDFDAKSLARELEKAGAAALSVLTDEEFFQGSLANLHLASESARLPCLRKDFIVDEFQVLEARASCADAILLIAAALSDAELKLLTQKACEFQLDVLCEVHDESELQRAMGAGCDLIGVNSRDLRTFAVDMDTAFRLVHGIPNNVVRVAESGIHSGADIAKLRAAGYQAFLIGEALMKAKSPAEALQALIAEAGTVISN